MKISKLINSLCFSSVVIPALAFSFTSCGINDDGNVNLKNEEIHLISSETYKEHDQLYGIWYFRFLFNPYRGQYSISLNTELYENQYDIEIVDKTKSIVSEESFYVKFKIKNYDSMHDISTKFDLLFTFKDGLTKKNKHFRFSKLSFDYILPVKGREFNVSINKDVDEIINSTPKYLCQNEYTTTLKCVDNTRSIDAESIVVKKDGKQIGKDLYDVTPVDQKTINLWISDQATNSNNLTVCVTTRANESYSYGQNIETYIKDRTFSLMANNTSTIVFGTGWIIDDATPSDNSDYQYYVATNWHVTRGFDNLITKKHPNIQYGIACDSFDPGKIIGFDNYEILSNDSYRQFDSSYSIFHRTDKYKENMGIDMYFCQIDFSCIQNQLVKQQLDRINDYKKQHGFINKFVNSDSQNVIDSIKSIGGYPVKDFPEETKKVGGGKWEFHTVQPTEEFPDKRFLYYDQINSDSHLIDKENYYDFSITDISSQYVYEEGDLDETWMSGGASGSMLVTQDCEICGIYWGGWLGSTQESGLQTFYPTCSLFKTNQYNFLDWLTK